MARHAPTSAAADAHFDADAIAASQRQPTLQVGGLLYRGRLLSIEEWLPFWERQQKIDSDAQREKTPVEARASLLARATFYREYLTAVFPRRDFKFWAPDPVKHVMAQPFQVVEETIAFFFILQALATFGAEAMEKATTKNSTGGTSSRPRTADASPEGA